MISAILILWRRRHQKAPLPRKRGVDAGWRQ